MERGKTWDDFKDQEFLQAISELHNLYATAWNSIIDAAKPDRYAIIRDKFDLKIGRDYRFDLYFKKCPAFSLYPVIKDQKFEEVQYDLVDILGLDMPYFKYNTKIMMNSDESPNAYIKRVVNEIPSLMEQAFTKYIQLYPQQSSSQGVGNLQHFGDGGLIHTVHTKDQQLFHALERLVDIVSQLKFD